MAMKKKNWGLVIIILIVIGVIIFFWPKSCGSGGFLPIGAVVRGCDCIGLVINESDISGCVDCGSLCFGVPKYYCYTSVNGTKTEVLC